MVSQKTIWSLDMTSKMTTQDEGFLAGRIASLRQRQLELAKEGRVTDSARLAGMVKALRNEPPEIELEIEGLEENA